MSVRIDGPVIHLEGPCPVEDAEPLLAALLATPKAVVELGGAGRLHTAIVQLLLAAGPRLTGIPQDAFAAAHLLPLLAGDERL